MTKPLLVLCPLILSVILAGCTQHEPGCYAVGSPGTGTMVAFNEHLTFAEADTVKTYEFIDETIVLDGSGTPRRVHAVQGPWATPEPGVALFSDVMVRQDASGIPWNEFAPGQAGWQLGTAAAGRCLRTGDEWQTPYLGYELMSNHTVTSASTQGLVVRSDHPAAPPLAGSGERPAYRVTSEWRGSATFPDQVRVDRQDAQGGWMALFAWTLLEQSVVPGERLEPIVLAGPDGTKEPFDRFPPMDLPFGRLTYREFVEFASGAPEVRDFLATRPNAFASHVRYLNVTEQESQAWVWQATIRDGNNESLQVSLARRCFDNPVHRIAFGPCRDATGYFAWSTSDPRRTDRPTTSPVNATSWWAKQPVVPAALALDTVHAVADVSEPSVVEFQAFRWASQTERFGIDPSPPAWNFGFGTVEGEATYAGRGAPHGVRLVVSVPRVWTDDLGWVHGVQADIPLRAAPAS